MEPQKIENNAEWSYALRNYAKPGVAPACLLLQDQLGMDVLVMLHLGYRCAAHATGVNEDTVAQADELVKDWRESVVRPLRAARRAIPKDDPSLQSLRASVQKVELEAEQQALARLAELPLIGPPAAMAVEEQMPVKLTARFYAERSGASSRLDTPEIAQAIQLLEAALASHAR